MDIIIRMEQTGNYKYVGSYLIIKDLADARPLSCADKIFKKICPA